jgi:hypothetical protein
MLFIKETLQAIKAVPNYLQVSFGGHYMQQQRLWNFFGVLRQNSYYFFSIICLSLSFFFL